MNREEHRQRHVQLHRAFDELLADYIAQSPRSMTRLPSRTSVMRLLKWSHEQTICPDELAPHGKVN